MGLYVQRNALLIAQKALDITGNNISNINTPGYTRQRVDICSVANAKGTLGYNTSVELAGMGSDVVGVAQIRDGLYDKKVRVYSGDLCDVGIKMDTLSNVEDVFDSIEADELNASFASILSSFKSALQSYSTDHADRSEMANITMNSAQSLVQCILTYNNKLNDISEQTLGDTRDTVKRVNTILSEMGSLNKQIKEAYISMGYFESSGNNYSVMYDYGPLELKDEMNKLLDELSQYGNLEVEEEADGTFTVDFADRRVVEGEKYAQMAITLDDPEPTKLEFVICKELMKKEEWYNLNVEHGTGGNTELIVRNFKDEVGGWFNISDKNTDGIYKLDSGSLRGYLDVYNGRGDYASGTKIAFEKAHGALQKLWEFNVQGGPKTDEEKAEAAECIKTVKDTIGVDVETAADGKYSATLAGKNLIGTSGGAVISTSGVVSVGGTGYPALSYNDLGGERGFDTINDALENLAEINKTINELTTKLNDPTLSKAKRTAAAIDRQNAYEEARRFSGILEDAGATITCDKTKGESVSVVFKTDGMDIPLLTDNNETVQKVSGSPNIQIDLDNNTDWIKTEDMQGAAAKYIAADKDIVPNTYQGIEYYRDMLNAFVKTVTDEFNGIYSEFNEGNGWEIFTYDNDNGEADFRAAAENFRVGKDWLKNPEIIANPSGENQYEELDNVYVNKLLGIFVNDQTYGDGVVTDSLTFPLEKYVSHICDNLGTKVAEEKTVYDATDIMLTGVEEERSGIMDVSMDEEGINMMNYQKWYNAISRMISTLDEALDKLINNTGIVGLR